LHPNAVGSDSRYSRKPSVGFSSIEMSSNLKIKNDRPIIG